MRAADLFREPKGEDPDRSAFVHSIFKWLGKTYHETATKEQALVKLAIPKTRNRMNVQEGGVLSR